jgi:uncharacterized membrane protein
MLKYYEWRGSSLRGGGWLQRLLLAVIAVVLLLIAFFFLTVALIVGGFLATAIGLRWWWLTRKLRARAKSSAAIEGEYTVLERADPGQQRIER